MTTKDQINAELKTLEGKPADELVQHYEQLLKDYYSMATELDELRKILFDNLNTTGSVKHTTGTEL